MKWPAFFICFAYFILTYGPMPQARAGTISMKVRVTLAVKRDFIRVNIQTTNAGNETARQVYATLSIFDRTLQSSPVDKLVPGSKQPFRFFVPIPSGKQGVFLFVGEVFFSDKRYSPFSALSAGTFRLKSRKPPALSGDVPGVRIKDRGKLKVMVQNPEQKSKTIKLTLHLPKALKTPEPRKTIRVPGGGSAVVYYPIAARYVSEAAVYPVFCSLQYDEDRGQHQTVLVHSTVKTETPVNWFVKTRWYWLAAGVLLALAQSAKSRGMK
ncbi:MAG: hypothetical protein JRJ04_12905 [Deltaproteobacteria bacterium]|nr:hypothetical protein [Deltaproteobacteria bacterium]